MSILRNQITGKFSIIENQLITDERISDAAFRVACYLISRPDNWQIRNKDIMKQLRIKRQETLSGYWKQLMSSGILHRKEKPKVNGRFGGYDYAIGGIPDDWVKQDSTDHGSGGNGGNGNGQSGGICNTDPSKTDPSNIGEDCRVFPPKQVFGDDKQKQSSPKKAPSKKSTSRAYHEDISEQEYPLAKHALEWLDGAMANAIERGETLNIAVSPHTGRPNVSREHLDAIEENLTDLATDAPDGIDGATHVVKRLAVLYNKYLCKLGKKVNFSMFCAASLDLDKRYGQWVEQMIRRGEA